MGVRKTGARAASAVSTWGLKHIARRPAANLPGRIALKIDPSIISELTDKIEKGSIVVVGTNGKTTVTNMIADMLETAGKSVICNRTGANMQAGIASTLLQSKPGQWGVFESDELWLGKTLPELKATYVVLLNLFRDQLDRCGEIDRIQETITQALKDSPDTTLIFNADDPQCAIIAKRVPNKTIAFGVDEDLQLAQNTVVDAQMCQNCSAIMDYAYRQYGQLGDYTCPNCGFSRPAFNFAATDVTLDSSGLAFSFSCTDAADGQVEAQTGAQSDVQTGAQTGDGADGHLNGVRITSSFNAAYMLYNLMAISSVASVVGCPQEALQKTIDRFDPQNGRLQEMTIQGRPMLLNLAKNPTGFNQNLKIITQAEGKKVVAFFINDNVADGHDISWIWDCDFEELASQEDIVVYAGGIRKNDLQLRLKYAGIEAKTINSVNEMVDEALKMPAEWKMYAIANYTSLPAVRSALTAREDKRPVDHPTEGALDPKCSTSHRMPETMKDQEPLRIVHLFPDLLNLYGDGGNVKVLENRCLWRGIPVQIEAVHYGESIDLSTADIVFLGGGPDREQKLASEGLFAMKDDIKTYVENGGVLLAICGGYQILGENWLMGDESVEGLSIIDAKTLRAGKGFDRLIDNIVLESPIAKLPVVGFENHAGRTKLGKDAKPFGTVISTVGHGNDDTSGADGVVYKNTIGTYLHGPLLGKNPEIADHLIACALFNKFGKPYPLDLLDDAVEKEANQYMVARLHTKKKSN